MRALPVLFLVLTSCAASSRPESKTPRVALRCEAAPQVPAPGATPPRMVAGAATVQLTDAQLAHLRQQGVTELHLSPTFCLDPRGQVSCIDFGSDELPGDVVERIIGAMQEWRFEPYVVDGQARPFCSQNSFHYRIG